ncbi:23S rRNA Gm-2251 2'-O-methyltransferase [Sinobacterium caligoides]|uniref:23S rRNA (guanosine-2'-O-)-methyltransferase RlmB n=1 Tax=Sinobacterium caligoides TaxID=933926 RepID=A0A3N2DPC1_9GAMM|nr:23S rRNA (guanosine(2251)-2'-O)-methyltransferase RlmB [Sinobacterium caligoides]ROS01661.1 23S rRNA Gm-2251 2'-O-methyltransferase [Sinobacterium caligoides]
MSEFDTVFGIHAVVTLLAKQPQRVRQVLLQEGREDQRLSKVLEAAEVAGLKCKRVKRRELDDLVRGKHQGVVAVCELAKGFSEDYLQAIFAREAEPLLLILDGVTDPHNLGALLRTADAAGVAAVIAPKDKSVGLTNTVAKVACGAVETVPFVTVTNLKRTMKWLQQQGCWIVGTAGEATESIYQTELSGSRAIVMGAEGDGMRRLTKECCDYLAYIPMAGTVSSLNVSVAAGVCLFEAVRQRSV